MTRPRPSSPPRRGRPPNSEGADTRERLLDAAAEVCIDVGFQAATLQMMAKRAGVTATAVYNYFDSREALLHAVGVRSLRTLTKAVEATGSEPFQAIATAYLQPEMDGVRRLLAELHLAARRDEKLATLLGDWHHNAALELAGWIPGDPDNAVATVKALFLVLLGLCHLEDLSSIDADPAEVAQQIRVMVAALTAEP